MRTADNFVTRLVMKPFCGHYPPMKTEAAAALKIYPPFQKGQVWKIGDMNLAVIMVGKTLVHHRRYTNHPRGVQTTMTSKADLQKYLMNGNAVLIAE